MFDRILPILVSSLQEYIYTILCFSEISLTRADILSDLIVLTSPHERSAYYIPRIVEGTLHDTTQMIFVNGKEYI